MRRPWIVLHLVESTQKAPSGAPLWTVRAHKSYSNTGRSAAKRSYNAHCNTKHTTAKHSHNTHSNTQRLDTRRRAKRGPKWSAAAREGRGAVPLAERGEAPRAVAASSSEGIKETARSRRIPTASGRLGGLGRKGAYFTSSKSASLMSWPGCWLLPEGCCVEPAPG